MSKENQLLKSKMKFYKTLINELDYMNFITNSNKFDKKIVEYQDKLSEIYIEYQKNKEKRDVNK